MLVPFTKCILRTIRTAFVYSSYQYVNSWFSDVLKNEYTVKWFY